MYCPKCGTLLEKDAKFCSKCGNKLDGIQNEKQETQAEPILTPVNPEIQERPLPTTVNPEVQVVPVLTPVNPEVQAGPIPTTVIEPIKENSMIPKNKVNQKWFYIGIGVVILIVLLGGAFFAGTRLSKKPTNQSEKLSEKANNKDDNDVFTVREYNLFNTDMPFIMVSESNGGIQVDGSEEALSKNIEIYGIYHSLGSRSAAYIYGKNNNSVPVVVNTDIEYYDGKGKRIDSFGDHSFVKANSEFVLNIMILDDSLDYKNTKLFYSASKQKSFYHDVSEVEVQSVLEKEQYSEKEVRATVTNLSNQAISNIDLGCVYYKDGKIVFAQTGRIFGIQPKLSASAVFYYTLQTIEKSKDGMKNKYIDFDDYRVFLFASYIYDSENY